MTVRPLDREEMSWHNITVLAMEMSESHQVAPLTPWGGSIVGVVLGPHLQA